MREISRTKHGVTCVNCMTEFPIEKCREGDCPKCGLTHSFLDGEYLPHPSDMVKVNLKNAPELLEDGAWYPIVYSTGKGGEEKGVYKYTCGQLERMDGFDSILLSECLWIGAKIQFPEGY